MVKSMVKSMVNLAGTVAMSMGGSVVVSVAMAESETKTESERCQEADVGSKLANQAGAMGTLKREKRKLIDYVNVPQRLLCRRYSGGISSVSVRSLLYLYCQRVRCML
jgi:hypothetical protein